MSPKELYSMMLDTPEWKDYRFRVFVRDDFRCQRCKCQLHSSFLRAHHVSYKRMPWPYGVPRPELTPLEDMTTLCISCHDYFENHLQPARKQLDNEWKNIVKNCGPSEYLIWSRIEFLRKKEIEFAKIKIRYGWMSEDTMLPMTWYFDCDNGKPLEDVSYMNTPEFSRMINLLYVGIEGRVAFIKGLPI